MKLNMRLTGWIFGLVMLSVLGRTLHQNLRNIRVAAEFSKTVAVVFFIIGAVFARLMQAAVSRQPEFLADALRKIGGFKRHGAIQASRALETRHLFFASSDFLGFGLATHPPLERRIRKIQPGWNG